MSPGNDAAPGRATGGRQGNSAGGRDSNRQYTDMQRRRDAAERSAPVFCDDCLNWVRDPEFHRCGPDHPVPEVPLNCGCYRPWANGHRNETCAFLGELTPPSFMRKWGR